MRRLSLPLALVLAFATPAAAVAATFDPAYGVAAAASYNYGGQVRDEECLGNGQTFNPCIVMHQPNLTISTDTSAFAHVVGDLPYPAGDDAFIVQHTESRASADLRTGDMKAYIEAPNGGYAGTRFQDTLFFDPSTFGGDSIDIVVSAALDGTYRQSNFAYLLSFQGMDDQLMVGTFYRGQGISDLQNVSAPLDFSINNRIGDWQVFETDRWIGIITVTATNPSLSVDGTISAGGFFLDLANTAKLNITMPAGVRYSSASGVFLTGAAGAVPEPATWAMMILGFGAVGGAMRRRRGWIGRAAGVA